MSRLHNPGPGEILDRLTILALKITHGRLTGISLTHWEDELHALIAISGGILHLGSEKDRTTYVHQLELAAVNGALWQEEDELRRLRLIAQAYEGWTGETARCGLRIQQLNDRRAELVTLINSNAGVNRPPDKL